MSGVTIIGELLRANAPIAAFLADRDPPVLAADQIKAGRLPDGVALPAFLIRTVSVVERQFLKRTGMVHTVERVSVAVRAASYRDQRKAIRLSRPACAGKVGAIAGFTNVSILTAGTGPDVTGPGDSYEQTQDFRVSFDAPA
ncbi:hypothetical protein [Sphingomonas sp. PB4P5]|uniref:hypothetical protein n=1 Tax=Parasphingomonas puruogangriensis TaxID=3096155 RepID=UPI002FC678F3